MAGLGSDLTTLTGWAIDHAFSFWPGGTWEIREAGVYRTEGRLTQGDRFRVTLSGSTVTYQQNGVTVYQTAAQPVFPLVMDTSIFTVGGGVTESAIGALDAAPPADPAESETTAQTEPAASGVITVSEGGDLQAALNQAAPGDTIVLQAGARFVGSFRLLANRDCDARTVDPRPRKVTG